jgi:hypothetical protein
MEGVVGVEMPANGVCVERNEQNVKELEWDELKASVRRRPGNWFAIYEESVFDYDTRMAKGGTITVIDARCL